MSENDENVLLEETEETENIQKKSKIPVTKKKLVIKVPTSKPVSEDEEEEEEETPKKVIKSQPKKERTEAQKLAFERCKKQREENAKKRADDAKKSIRGEVNCKSSVTKKKTNKKTGYIG
jgi:hypothetical protein